MIKERVKKFMTDRTTFYDNVYSHTSSCPPDTVFRIQVKHCISH